MTRLILATSAALWLALAFLAPGDPDSPPQAPKQTWRDVFGIEPYIDALSPSEQCLIVKARHRKLIAEAHPDVGGAHMIAAELNAALDDAERELGGRQ